MTDQPTSSLRRRAAGIAASALMLANVLATPAAVMAAGPGTPPNLVNDVITTVEETPVSGNVLANDSNPSGVVPFTVTSFTGPAASVGTLVIASDGSYTFTPAPNFSGSGSASYMASNTKHEVGPAQITINVTNVQDPPVAGDDTITVVEDTATNVTSAILANDADPDGDTLSVTGASGATGGSVSVGATVTFTPAANLCGPGAGSFDYTLSATGGTDTAHVIVNITCVDDAPVAVNDHAAGTEDTDVQVAESDLVANDTDVEGDSLSVSGVSNPSGGTVSRSGGTVTFTPDANLCGDNAASFHYTVNDGNGGTDNGKVTIDLTCEPEAPVAHDDTASGTEDTDVVIPAGDLTANDTDADGDSLSVTNVLNPSGGTVNLAGGTITFTPAENVCGTGAGSFDYTVDDGGNGGTDTGSVSIDLTCVNDAPVAKHDSVTATEDTAADLTADLLANDTDADGDTLSIVDFANVVGGSVDLTGGVLTFTPDGCGDAYGSFDYQVSDGNGGTDWATATVDVTCVNDAPVATNDHLTGTEDTALVIDPADLVANDADADNDPLGVSSVGNPSGGTVSLDAGMITFTPDANLCGTDVASFDYTLDDGNGGTDTGTVTITLDCVNDSPSASDGTASGTEDQDVVVDATELASASTDTENDGLTVTDASNPVGGTVALVGTTITFTPDANLCGTDVASFDYTVDDGNGGTDTGTVTITLDCVNDSPVANDDTKSATEDTALVISDLTGLTGNDTDVDQGDTLSVTSVSNPTGGTVALVAGTITFTPAADLCGTGVGGFDYDLSDGHAGTDTGHVTVDIACANDSPVANDDVASGTEDTALVISDLTGLTGNDTDVDAGDTLSVTSVSNPTGGTVSLVGGTITFTPAANLCGEDVASFDYTVDDGNDATDTGTVTISLDCVNDAPVAVDDTATVQENSAAADYLVLANDTDVEHDALHVESASVSSTAGTVSTTLTKVTFTPKPGFAGLASITYVVSDGDKTDSGTLAITVNAVSGPDVTAPHPFVPGVSLGTGRVDDTAPLRITWSATDAGSGVATYQVQLKINGAPYKTIYQGKGTSVGVIVPFKASLLFRVRATDKQGNRSGWATTATRRVIAAQNLNPNVKFKGGWTFVASRASSGGGYSFSTKLGASAAYVTSAVQIGYIAPKMASGGFVKVFIDGHLVGRYSLHNASLALGRVIARFTVTSGQHTIRVVNDQAGKRTTHDAFVMLR